MSLEIILLPSQSEHAGRTFFYVLYLSKHQAPSMSVAGTLAQTGCMAGLCILVFLFSKCVVYTLCRHCAHTMGEMR